MFALIELCEKIGNDSVLTNLGATIALFMPEMAIVATFFSVVSFGQAIQLMLVVGAMTS